MRTTVDVDKEVLAEAKQVAVRSGRTLSQVVEDALRETYARRAAASERKPFRFPTAGGDGVAEGVDLNSNASLLDAMDRND